MKLFLIASLSLLLCFPAYSKSTAATSHSAGLNFRISEKATRTETNASSSNRWSGNSDERVSTGNQMQRNFSTGISKEAAASVSPNSKALKKQSRVSGTDAIRGLHHTLSGNTNGLISLLLGAFGGLMGLIGLFLGPFTLLCGLFSIAGIIFGIAGLKKDEKKTMATIGLVWNSINFILGTISLIAWIAIILMY